MSNTPASETIPSAASSVKVASWAEKFVSSTASSTLSPGGTSKRNATRSSSSSCDAGINDHTVDGAASPAAAAGRAYKVVAASISSAANRAAKGVGWEIAGELGGSDRGCQHYNQREHQRRRHHRPARTGRSGPRGGRRRVECPW